MGNIQTRSTKTVLPKFIFVCMDPKTLTLQAAHETINAVFAIDENLQYCKKYIALVEDDGSPQDSGEPPRRWNYPLPGEQYRFGIAKVEAVLKTKDFHALEHLRHPGHKSTHARATLTSDTLPIVIGSGEFLARNAILYFEREGPLYAELVELLYLIIGLSERKKKSKLPTYIHYQVESKKFYPGNFDALLEAVQGPKSKIMTTDEMLQSFE